MYLLISKYTCKSVSLKLWISLLLAQTAVKSCTELKSSSYLVEAPLSLLVRVSPVLSVPLWTRHRFCYNTTGLFPVFVSFFLCFSPSSAECHTQGFILPPLHLIYRSMNEPPLPPLCQSVCSRPRALSVPPSGTPRNLQHPRLTN